MEAIKILTDQVGVLSGKMLIFDGLSTTFHNVTLRSPNSKCIACNDRPLSNFTDYEEFCGTMSHDKVLINIFKLPILYYKLEQSFFE